MSSQYNLSALYSDEHLRAYPATLPRWLDIAFQDTLSAAHLEQLASAHHSAAQANGCTPALLNARYIPKARESVYESLVSSLNANVYTPECIAARRADTTWWLNTLTPQQFTKDAGYSTTTATSTIVVTAKALNNGNVHVTVTGVPSTSASYTLYNIAGKELGRGTLPTVPVERYTLDGSRLPPGSVYMRVRTGNGHETGTLVER